MTTLKEFKKMMNEAGNSDTIHALISFATPGAIPTFH